MSVWQGMYSRNANRSQNLQEDTVSIESRACAVALASKSRLARFLHQRLSV